MKVKWGGGVREYGGFDAIVRGAVMEVLGKRKDGSIEVWEVKEKQVGPNDGGMVTWIDGDELKGTDMGRNVIPSPMAEIGIKDKSGIYYVRGWRMGKEEGVVEMEEGVGWIKDGKFNGVLETGRVRGLEVDRRTNAAVYIKEGTTKSIVVRDLTTGEVRDTHDGNMEDVFEVVDGYHAVRWGKGEDKKAEVFELETNQTLHELMEEGVPIKIEVLYPDPNEPDERKMVLSLTSTSRLYLNDRILSTSVTSFVVSRSHGFLVYCTNDGNPLLHCEDVTRLMRSDEMDGVDQDEGSGWREEGRTIERDTVVVAVTEDKPNVILRHHRGNYEGVTPRPIVLRTIRKLIGDRKWREAFDLCRRLKVDFNFLCDYKPMEFMEDIGGFVKGVKKGDWISLFVATLQGADFSRFKYPDYLNPPKPMEHESEEIQRHFQDKTNIICRALRAHMVSTDPSRHLKPILSTYAKQTPPLLPDALALIKSTSPSVTSKEAQAAIKYLAFLCTYEVLYEEAIGTYDFELAKGVAMGSQMDPKVYLRELGTLENEEELRGRYLVDVRLKRWEKAVRNLAASGGSTEDVVRMCEKHALYSVALEIYKDGAERGRVMEVVAEKHVKDGFPGAAVSLLLGLGKFGRAVEIAKIENDWEAVMTYFGSVDEEEREEMVDVVEELVEYMEVSKKRLDLWRASTLLLQYDPTNDNQERAIKLLTSGCYFIAAARECGRLNLPKALLGSVLDSARNAARMVSTDIEERRVKFKVNFENYLKSKELYDENERRKEEEGFNEGEGFGTGGNGSEYSAATSFSNISMSSNLSAKSYTSGYSGTSTAFTFNKGDNQSGGKFKSNREANKIKNRERRNAKRLAKKMQPGSIEEVRYYKGVLVECKVGEEERDKIVDTINYLVREGEVEGLAKRLFQSYEGMRDEVGEGGLDFLEMDQLPGNVNALFELL